MVCWFICYCLSDVTYYKTVHVCVCEHPCTFTVYGCYSRNVPVFMGVFMMFVFACLCAGVCMRLLPGVCFVCVTDIIWCRLVSVLRLQAVSQRRIDKWIWFANVIKLIRKTAMGCWAQISWLQYLCFFSHFHFTECISWPAFLIEIRIWITINQGQWSENNTFKSVFFLIYCTCI